MERRGEEERGEEGRGEERRGERRGEKKGRGEEGKRGEERGEERRGEERGNEGRNTIGYTITQWYQLPVEGFPVCKYPSHSAVCDSAQPQHRYRWTAPLER